MTDLSKICYLEVHAGRRTPPANKLEIPGNESSGMTAIDWSSQRLFGDLLAGADRAPDDLVKRYRVRLLGLLRCRLSKRLHSRCDPEDAVQSTFRSFFASAGVRRWQLRRRGDLWRLLATIAVRKAARYARRNRDVLDGRVRPFADDELSERTAVDNRESDHSESRASHIAGVDARDCEILSQKSLGASTAEIASHLGVSERTVRRRIRALQDDRRHVGASFREEMPYREFLLQEFVGGGRTARVFRAMHRPSGATVAVKFLRKSAWSSLPEVERFLAEYRLVQRLGDPGVAKVHGCGATPQGGRFIVMEYCARGDLHSRLRAGDAADGQLHAWFLALARTLDRIHRRGVVHCDLKPANVLLGDDDRALLTDFGFAKPRGSYPRWVEGTLPFLAPEQVSRRWGPISTRTDVYGFGATLFAALTGSPPFPGKTAEEIVARIDTQAAPTCDSAAFAGTRARLFEIALRCLAKRPMRRYLRMREVVQALELAPGDGTQS